MANSIGYILLLIDQNFQTIEFEAALNNESNLQIRADEGSKADDSAVSKQFGSL